MTATMQLPSRATAGDTSGAAGPPEVAPWLVALAKLMDSAFTIPGTRTKFGLDALIGLIPVVGDLLPALLAFVYYQEGKRLGVSKWTQFRMMLNTGLDVLIGVIPVVGDLLDV